MRELDITVSLVHENSEGKHVREHATATTSRITIQDCIEKFVGVLTSVGFDNQSIKNGIAEYAYCNCIYRNERSSAVTKSLSHKEKETARLIIILIFTTIEKMKH